MSRVTPTILGLGAVLMVSACGLPDTKPGPPAAECSIESVAEKAPGYPYDLNVFETTVAPALKGGCAGSTCHGEPAGLGGFTVWNDIAKGDCGFAQTFNSLSAAIDLNNPDQSKVVLALTTSATHPVKSAPVAATLLDYAEKASALLNPGGGGGPGDPNANFLDYQVFQSTIQPMLDATNAQGVSCYGCHQSVPQMTLKPAPALDSDDAKANFFAVVDKVGLNAPAKSSTFYQRATTNHGGGSRLVSPTEAAAIEAWIVAGQALGGGNNPQPGCVPVENFNLGVFRDEIMPVLIGEGINSDNNGCHLAGCHGTVHGPNSLVIKETATAEENLASFACFINLTNPVASAVLACPTNTPGCPKNPHPGQDVFEDANDPDFQRILSFLYATKTTTQPLDFAFFARQINPIFGDVNAVANGASNLTCDSSGCHKGLGIGGPADNFSNFPIVSGSDEATLANNFSQAINFTNFLTPEGSSLFLYPTNEIANIDNPFATGFPHPGGLDFAVDSVQALAILKWANGLRPNNQGFVRDWLVAGDYNATLITSQTPIQEATIAPSIFDPMFSATFNAGQWEGLFSVADEVDLNLEFPRAATAGRIGYAVAYFSNITGFDIQAQMLVTSNNAIRVLVDGQPVAQADDATNGVTALVRLPAGNKSTRVMIKVFQRAADDDFSFSVQLSDELGNLLTDATGEVVVKLSSDGGI